MVYLWAALVVLLVMAAFAMANPTGVQVNVLWLWRYQTTTGIAMIASAAVGAFVVLLAGTIRQRHLGRRVNQAERRVRDLEQQIARAPADTTQITRPSNHTQIARP